MVCAPVRSIIHSLKLGDYLSVQAHKPCSIFHLFAQKEIDFLSSKVMFRARLFKTNDVVSKRDVKISNVNISNMPIFFVEKNVEAFAVQKLLSFFQPKISVYLVMKSQNT